MQWQWLVLAAVGISSVALDAVVVDDVDTGCSDGLWCSDAVGFGSQVLDAVAVGTSYSDELRDELDAVHGSSLYWLQWGLLLRGWMQQQWALAAKACGLVLLDAVAVAGMFSVGLRSAVLEAVTIGIGFTDGWCSDIGCSGSWYWLH